MTDIGPLAAALAKAQTAFPTVAKDKKVTVQTKTGGSYSFNYAPLDSILNAVRKPLAANGLVLVQLLDDGALVTSLIHDSGALLSGRVDLPNGSDIQAFGSAITYLRRYAIQAMLGIAAEDDDDGNRAAGNTTRARSQRPVGEYDEPPDRPELERTTHENGLVGVANLGKNGGASTGTDYQLRQERDGGHVIGFRLTQGRKGYKVLAFDPLASVLASQNIIGDRVTCWGTMHDESFRDDATGRLITYQIMHLERIATPDFTLPSPAVDTPLPEAESLPVWEGLTDEEKALIAEGAPG
jgi:hypothetical protein